MQTIVLANKAVTFSSKLEGTNLLSSELNNLLVANEKLHEQRISLLYGIEKISKKQVRIRPIEESGLTSSGESLVFRRDFQITPHPRKTYDFDMITDNILNLVGILRRNANEIKGTLESMRNIIEEAHNNNLYISDMLYTLYLNSEKLYCGIKWDIGFPTNIVEIITNFL